MADVPSLTYQAIGLYAYFPKLRLPGITTDSTIEKVLNKVQAMNEDSEGHFRYSATEIETDDNKKKFFIVNNIDFTFNDKSQFPPNANKKTSKRGYRSLSLKGVDLNNKNGNLLNKKFFTVWQYFREVEATPIDAEGNKIGYPVIIRLQSYGQPKFQQTPLSGAIHWGKFGTFDNFKKHYKIETWRLIHRQVVVPVRTNLVNAYEELESLIIKSRKRENNDKGKIDAYVASQDVGDIRDSKARRLAYAVEDSSLDLHLTPARLVELELINADQVDDYQLTLSDYINAEMASSN